MSKTWIVRMAYEFEIQAKTADEALDEVRRLQRVKSIGRLAVRGSCGACAPAEEPKR